MSAVERKNFLNDRLKIDIFDTIDSKYKNLLKEENYKLKTFNNSDEIKNYNYNIDDEIKILEDKIKLYEIDSILYNDQLDKYNMKLNDNIKLLKYIDDKYSTYSINYLTQLIIFEEETINDIPLHDYLNDEYIDKLYNENLLLTSKLKQISTNYECKLSIDQYKHKLSKLNLVKNKDNIIKDHEIFEKHKIDRLITLKSQLNHN